MCIVDGRPECGALWFDANLNVQVELAGDFSMPLTTTSDEFSSFIESLLPVVVTNLTSLDPSTVTVG